MYLNKKKQRQNAATGYGPSSRDPNDILNNTYMYGKPDGSGPPLAPSMLPPYITGRFDNTQNMPLTYLAAPAMKQGLDVDSGRSSGINTGGTSSGVLKMDPLLSYLATRSSTGTGGGVRTASLSSAGSSGLVDIKAWEFEWSQLEIMKPIGEGLFFFDSG